MKNIFLTALVFLFLVGCDQPVEKTRGVPALEKVKIEAPVNTDSLEKLLREKGYETFRYKDGDTTFLMQQYYIAFLKTGKNRNQDSTEAAQLQKQHLDHLNRMVKEDFASLAGPFGDEGEIRGIMIYHTPTQREADSLAKLDPMVKAGRLEVEVHPWWTAKGGKLQ